ncbi:MFS transporter [Granulicella arctica]|uniref:SHS family lactate transporter-like MFS transporter n=1 Tax=Granulicella arctica TaxID=940613 RepID=A0A7Y9PE02_9BACT|nr:MFS transporter [Granulicella arctica]NYF78062.1 SHS family lactate transporter-like MFS transporter [Granulicella arctica]
MKFTEQIHRLTASQRNAFIACFLGWSLDAFDYFILVFCVSAIAKDFHTQVTQVAEALFLTLAMRPVGAFLFGRMADKYGRRPTLMINIICYSLFELASAFAPSLKMLLIFRALFGIAMGGEWGVGAALAFETLPAEGRGFFSGLLQEGYVVGNLIAGIVYALVFQYVGWRGMFLIGAVPAFLVLYIRSRVEESPAWLEAQRQGGLPVAAALEAKPSLWVNLRSYAPTFLFLVVLMTAFASFSHGTQDLYPTFLEKNHAFGPRETGLITSVGNVGALLGGICFGAWSETMGRRKTILIASLLAIPMIPLWAWSHTVVLISVGAFLMQFMVQGAWGVVPAHLNELSPAPVRGTFPGLAYQLGNLLSSRNGVLQAKLAASRFGGNFRVVLSATVFIVALLVAVVALLGREEKGADLSSRSS